MSSNIKADKEISNELDQLEAEYSSVPENRTFIGRGPKAIREHLRLASAPKKQLTIRLDADIVERFKDLAGEDGSYQTLMNRALHEWLEAQSIGELLDSQIQRLETAIRRQETKELVLPTRDPRES